MSKKICQHFEVSVDTLSLVRSHVGAKQEDIVLSRQVVVYYSVRYITAIYGYDKINRPLGMKATQIYRKVAGMVNRDRATIIHSLKVIDNYLFTDRSMRTIISEMDNQFQKYLPETEEVMIKHQLLLNQKNKPNE
jgi:hypothetical protein